MSTSYQADAPAPASLQGPLIMTRRGNSPPPQAGGEGAVSPLLSDAEGRLRVSPGPQDQWSTTYYATAATNTAVAITLAAQAPDLAWEIAGVVAGYDAGGTLAGGSLTITDGGSTVFKAPITANGDRQMPFPRPRVAAPASAVVITLAAGGTGVIGFLNLFGVRRALAPGFTQRLFGILDFSDPNQSGYI